MYSNLISVIVRPRCFAARNWAAWAFRHPRLRSCWRRLAATRTSAFATGRTSSSSCCVSTRISAELGRPLPPCTPYPRLRPVSPQRSRRGRLGTCVFPFLSHSSRGPPPRAQAPALPTGSDACALGARYLGGGPPIARHRRSYEGEDTVFDPLHYLPLIERKIGALDQAAPLAGWELPDASRPFAG